MKKWIIESIMLCLLSSGLIAMERKIEKKNVEKKNKKKISSNFVETSKNDLIKSPIESDLVTYEKEFIFRQQEQAKKENNARISFLQDTKELYANLVKKIGEKIEFLKLCDDTYVLKHYKMLCTTIKKELERISKQYDLAEEKRDYIIFNAEKAVREKRYASLQEAIGLLEAYSPTLANYYKKLLKYCHMGNTKKIIPFSLENDFFCENKFDNHRDFYLHNFKVSAKKLNENFTKAVVNLDENEYVNILKNLVGDDHFIPTILPVLIVEDLTQAEKNLLGYLLVYAAQHGYHTMVEQLSLFLVENGLSNLKIQCFSATILMCKPAFDNALAEAFFNAVLYNQIKVVKILLPFIISNNLFDLKAYVDTNILAQETLKVPAKERLLEAGLKTVILAAHRIKISPSSFKNKEADNFLRLYREKLIAQDMLEMYYMILAEIVRHEKILNKDFPSIIKKIFLLQEGIDNLCTKFMHTGKNKKVLVKIQKELKFFKNILSICLERFKKITSKTDQSKVFLEDLALEFLKTCIRIDKGNLVVMLLPNAISNKVLKNLLRYTYKKQAYSCMSPLIVRYMEKHTNKKNSTKVLEKFLEENTSGLCKELGEQSLFAQNYFAKNNFAQPYFGRSKKLSKTEEKNLIPTLSKNLVSKIMGYDISSVIGSFM